MSEFESNAGADERIKIDERIKMLEDMNKKQVGDLNESVKKAIAHAKEVNEEPGKIALMEKTLNELNDEPVRQGENSPAQCPAEAVDCCEIRVPWRSVFDAPPRYVIGANDPWYLECFISQVEILANTPCGVLPCVVNEVRAIGKLPFVFDIQLHSYLWDDCYTFEERTFSCTGTTCVNEVLCYVRLNEDTDPCPNFCGNVETIAYFNFEYTCGDDRVLVYSVVHYLPDCNG